MLSGGSTGLIVENGATATAATITGSNLAVKNNYFGGLFCIAACTLDLAGGEVSGNGTTIPDLAGGYGFYGGVWLGASDKVYSAKLRNVSVINNASLSTGNTNTAENSGITLAGTAASSYDLGTPASPGGNVSPATRPATRPSGINVRVAARGRRSSPRATPSSPARRARTGPASTLWAVALRRVVLQRDERRGGELSRHERHPDARAVVDPAT